MQSIVINTNVNINPANAGATTALAASGGSALDRVAAPALAVSLRELALELEAGQDTLRATWGFKDGQAHCALGVAFQRAGFVSDGDWMRPSDAFSDRYGVNSDPHRFAMTIQSSNDAVYNTALNADCRAEYAKRRLWFMRRLADFLDTPQ